MLAAGATVVGVVCSCIHYSYKKRTSAKMRGPDFWVYLYKYLLFFGIGIAGLLHIGEIMLHSWQQNDSFCELVQSQLLSVVAARIAVAIGGITAVSATNNYRAAVITIFAVQSLLSAISRTATIICQNTYDPLMLSALSYELALPIILVVLYFAKDKFRIFR